MGKNNIELLKLAQAHLGEGGAVFNRYCHSSGYWCCAYVTYMFHEGDDSKLFYGGKVVVYCPTAIKWCSANLAMIPPYLALPMDIGFFDWNHNGLPDHIGFIRARKSCDEVYTIEGNTDKVKNGKVVAHSVVAERIRPVGYIQGIYRPHFPAKFDISKPLEIDGLFGYNSIAMLQKALGGLDVDGILGKATVKKLQAWAGVAQDGAWGTKTSKAIQKKLKVTADGLFGKESCKALQRWANAQVFPQQTWVDKANAWARKIAKEKYHYVRWKSGITATHTCPICTGRKYDNYYGWNCIGFAFACWHHGGGLKNKCSCGVISSGKGGQWDRLLKDSQATANANATKWTGVPCTVIRNGGKALTKSMLKAGDILCMYNNGTAQHIIYYMGDGKFAESNSSGSADKHIRADLTLSNSWLSKIKVAVRYVGK